MPQDEYAAPEPLDRLKSAFGETVELQSEDGGTQAFRIRAEFRLGSRVYAALQTEAMRKEDEVELFRIVGSDEEPQLETIEDDEEWELAAEAFDDLQFAGDEQP